MLIQPTSIANANELLNARANKLIASLSLSGIAIAISNRKHAATERMLNSDAYTASMLKC
ncbi:hypothetical protein GCM10008098_20680 [Rhodanobacter panaciterrae]|uniref:Uncharacterized protein n=1 Tax=Rhodanobacter panaciterrae TaxID=490572 RepID=A0ABQ2ZZE1_9GAMM|nr:hypothetical protein GCM10008098_20680 [Rhodanobacter panaciterrae]